MSSTSAKDRFKSARRAVVRLHQVQLAIMNRCEDWRPPSANSRTKSVKPDPTAAAAIYNVDTLEGKLGVLRAEEEELKEEIGEALVLVEAVRKGLGEKYADVLELRYIDCTTWADVKERTGMARRTARDCIDVACDWIDSVGLTRILTGDLEL